METDIINFTKTFEKVAYGNSESGVFDDFLDIFICCLSSGRYEDEYLAIVKKYSREQVDLFCELVAKTVILSDNDGKGLTDCLGEFFQQRISRGSNGQIFTPEHVCDFMGAVVGNEDMTGKKILDPCCGSGRMLLSAAKQSRDNFFLGADIDARCCKMTTINLCLNGLVGEVARMNSITHEHWGGFTIFPDENRRFVPTIKKLGVKEGYLDMYREPEPKKITEDGQQEKSEIEVSNKKVICATQTMLEI